MKVFGQPVGESEAGLAGGAVAPGGGYFGDFVAFEKGLDNDLHTQLEASGALDSGVLQHFFAVHLEAVGDVMGGDANEQMQRYAGQAGEEFFQERAADLSAAGHVT